MTYTPAQCPSKSPHKWQGFRLKVRVRKGEKLCCLGTRVIGEVQGKMYSISEKLVDPLRGTDQTQKC